MIKKNSKQKSIRVHSVLVNEKLIKIQTRSWKLFTRTRTKQGVSKWFKSAVLSVWRNFNITQLFNKRCFLNWYSSEKRNLALKERILIWLTTTPKNRWNSFSQGPSPQFAYQKISYLVFASVPTCKPLIHESKRFVKKETIEEISWKKLACLNIESTIYYQC